MLPLIWGDIVMGKSVHQVGQWRVLMAVALLAVAPAATRPASAQPGFAGAPIMAITRVEHDGGSFEAGRRGEWTEYDRSGRAKFQFREESRNRGVIRLYDPSRGGRLEIDLAGRVIRYAGRGANFSTIYRITNATGARPGFGGGSGPGFNGGGGGGINRPGAVSAVYHARGSFVRTGGRNWAELDGNGRQKYRFVEERQDRSSIVLFDRSRNGRLQIDLIAGRIRYASGGGRYNDVYTITSVEPGGGRPGFRP